MGCCYALQKTNKNNLPNSYCPWKQHSNTSKSSDWSKSSRVNVRRTTPPSHRLTSHNIALTAEGSTCLTALSAERSADMASHESLNELGSSSSEEDSNRADMFDGSGEEKPFPAVRLHHPFSVEALMAGRKTDTRRSTCLKPKEDLMAVTSACFNSLYLCRETSSPPGGSQRGLTEEPSSPVKSEASESEECASWVRASPFSTQLGTFISACLQLLHHQLNTLTWKLRTF